MLPCSLPSSFHVLSPCRSSVTLMARARPAWAGPLPPRPVQNRAATPEGMPRSAGLGYRHSGCHGAWSRRRGDASSTVRKGADTPRQGEAGNQDMGPACGHARQGPCPTFPQLEHPVVRTVSWQTDNALHGQGLPQLTPAARHGRRPRDPCVRPKLRRDAKKEQSFLQKKGQGVASKTLGKIGVALTLPDPVRVWGGCACGAT